MYWFASVVAGEGTLLITLVAAFPVSRLSLLTSPYRLTDGFGIQDLHR